MLLACLLACAALLRFWGLRDRGFMIWDEAYYALEGGTVPHAVHRLAEGGGMHEVKRCLVDGGNVLPTGTAKPGFMLLLSLWGLAFGTSDFAGMSMTASAGVLCVLLAFFAARRCAGTAAGLCAAFFLTFSGLHIWYSRVLLGNSIAAAFLMLGLLAYVRAASGLGGRRSASAFFAAGAVAGFAFMVHYALLPNLAALALCELMRLWDRRENIARELVNSLSLAAGLLSVMSAAELATRCAYRALSSGLAGVAHLTYFQYLARQFLWNAPTGNHIGWACGLYMSGLRDFLGWPSALMYAAALVLAVVLFLRERDLAFRLFIVQTWCTLLFWLLSPGVAAMRVMAVLAPLLAVTAALVSVTAAKDLGRPLRLWWGASLLAASLAGAALCVPEMLRARSVYPEAAAWLAANGEKSPASLVEWPFLQFYLGSKIYNNDDRLNGELAPATLMNSGTKYLVITNTEKDWLGGKKTYPGLLASLKNSSPEASWRTGAGGRFLAYDGMFYPQFISEVEIYKLSKLRGR